MNPDNPIYEQLLRDAVSDAVFLLDREGLIVTWNRGAERLFGYTEAEILGRPFTVLHPPDALERRQPEQALKAAQESGRYEDEARWVRTGAIPVWVRTVITPVRDERGEVRGFWNVAHDLTKQRQKEEILRLSEERLRLFVEGIKDAAAFGLDREGNVTTWNAGAERLTGYKAEEIVGRHFAVLYSPAALERKLPEQELAMAREQGRFDGEGLRLRPDGSTFWSNMVVSPLYDEQGVLTGYAVAMRDLTDRKRAEALEQSERQTTEFLAMVAHELRNPLAPISNALQLLARKPVADSTEQWVREVLQRQTAEITRLVEDLLDVSRISRAAITLDRRPVDVRSVLREAVDRWSGLSLELSAESLVVDADPARLTQMVQNLLHSNARQARKGAPLRVAAGRAGALVEISVRGEASTEGAQETLDVGLTLVQRLAQMHGGAFERRGAALVVALPALGPAAVAPPARASAGVPHRRVLVVDDNSDAANALKLLLESDGHEVKVATDGVAGLALAREYRPDYLLLDIGLPRLSGYDIAASLRADPALKNTTMVAITGYGQLHDRARTAAVGFDHHLTKPVEYAALQALLRGER